MSPPDDVIAAPEVVEGGHVTPAEVDRVRLFYSSLASVVVVCRSLADVSVGSVGRDRGTGAAGAAGAEAAGAGARAAGARDDARASGARAGAGCSAAADSVAGCRWVHLLTGVPVLVLSVGGRRRARRELTLLAADRSTAMPLWQDRVNSMSALRRLAGGGAATLTMRVSGGLTKRVRLDVFSRCAAAEFMAAYETVTGDPDDELWNISHDTKPAAHAVRLSRRLTVRHY